MQLAGRICSVCAKKVVLAKEAAFCSRCDIVVHLACDATVCPGCGAILTGYDHSKAEMLGDTVVPRALRPGKTGAAAFAILFVVLFALLMLYLGSLA